MNLIVMKQFGEHFLRDKVSLRPTERDLWGGGLLLPASRKTACCFMLIYVVFEFSEGGVIDSIELQN